MARKNRYPEIELRPGLQLVVVHDHKNNRGFQLSNEFCQAFEAELQQIKESSKKGMEQELQKIFCIAKVCRNLQFTHPFKDGNGRTFGCILVNGLLMREGLSPSLIDDANKFDAYSVDELVEVIRSGQRQFNALKSRF
ncbi:Fic family protein [Endozoicomonas gorgoniicola]|uniref:Fic family protein n=1 Tax=Endozoicomonas gorgoniicola TaxID=1234144 RepID=A0ABT3N0Q6_9GAMM|nr:Fic family protein [Endozoicomonas gorgoniicola]MCW7555199.1 Fic family protein [Endozoicomonas gorgoniicola]